LTVGFDLPVKLTDFFLTAVIIIIMEKMMRQRRGIPGRFVGGRASATSMFVWPIPAYRTLEIGVNGTALGVDSQPFPLVEKHLDEGVCLLLLVPRKMMIEWTKIRSNLLSR
jgi:hypothetical protein